MPGDWAYWEWRLRRRLRSQENFGYHTGDSGFDSITNCSNSNLRYILFGKIDDFKGYHSYEEPDFVDVEKGLGEMLKEPKYLKRIINKV